MVEMDKSFLAGSPLGGMVKKPQATRILFIGRCFDKMKLFIFPKMKLFIFPSYRFPLE